MHCGQSSSPAASQTVTPAGCCGSRTSGTGRPQRRARSATELTSARQPCPASHVPGSAGGPSRNSERPASLRGGRPRRERGGCAAARSAPRACSPERAGCPLRTPLCLRAAPAATRGRPDRRPAARPAGDRRRRPRAPARRRTGAHGEVGDYGVPDERADLLARGAEAGQVAAVGPGGGGDLGGCGDEALGLRVGKQAVVASGFASGFAGGFAGAGVGGDQRRPADAAGKPTGSCRVVHDRSPYRASSLVQLSCAHILFMRGSRVVRP